MKTRLACLASVIAILLLSIPGCKKDTTTGKTNTELITEGSWKFSNATAGSINISGFLEECQTDNTITLGSGGNGTLDEGATRCNTGDPQTESFTWNFAGNESVIHVSTQLFTGGSSDFDLEDLSESVLVVSQNVMISGAGTQRVVFTFIH